MTVAVYECNYNQNNAPTETPAPTAESTAEPTATPTEEPTVAPTKKPTGAPTAEPTVTPTVKPTAAAPTAESIPTVTTGLKAEATELKTASIIKLKVNGKKLMVTIKKVSGADKYEIQYSTKKSFAKKYAKAVFSDKTITIIKKLKSKKTYYVRARAYKLVDGKKVYSGWSKIKSVKIK